MARDNRSFLSKIFGPSQAELDQERWTQERIAVWRATWEDADDYSPQGEEWPEERLGWSISDGKSLKLYGRVRDTRIYFVVEPQEDHWIVRYGRPGAHVELYSGDSTRDAVAAILRHLGSGRYLLTRFVPARSGAGRAEERFGYYERSGVRDDYEVVLRHVQAGDRQFYSAFVVDGHYVHHVADGPRDAVLIAVARELESDGDGSIGAYFRDAKRSDEFSRSRWELAQRFGVASATLKPLHGPGTFFLAYEGPNAHVVRYRLPDGTVPLTARGRADDLMRGVLRFMDAGDGEVEEEIFPRFFEDVLRERANALNEDIEAIELDEDELEEDELEEDELEEDELDEEEDEADEDEPDEEEDEADEYELDEEEDEADEYDFDEEEDDFGEVDEDEFDEEEDEADEEDEDDFDEEEGEFDEDDADEPGEDENGAEDRSDNEGDEQTKMRKLAARIRALGPKRTVEYLVDRVPDGVGGAATARVCLYAMGRAAEEGAEDIKGSKKAIRIELNRYAEEKMSERSFRDAYKLLQEHIAPLFEEVGPRQNLVRISRLRGEGW